MHLQQSGQENESKRVKRKKEKREAIIQNTVIELGCVLSKSIQQVFIVLRAFQPQHISFYGFVELSHVK